MTAVLASPARFERATFRLGGGRSILLSYGDIYQQLFYLIFEKESITLCGRDEIYLETAPGTDVFRTAVKETAARGAILCF